MYRLMEKVKSWFLWLHFAETEKLHFDLHFHLENQKKKDEILQRIYENMTPLFYYENAFHSEWL